MAIEREIIKKKHLLLCEGADAMYFFVYMLSSPDFCEDKRISEEIQVMNFGGIKDLSNFLHLLKLREGFLNVESILIVRDAESNVESAIDSIKSSLKTNGYVVPKELATWCDAFPRVAFVLLPTLNKKCCSGALEDLCCSLVAEENRNDIFEDIDSFLDEMKNKQGYVYPRVFKNRLHTYLSIKDEFVSFKIGEAARSNAFDWKSNRLNDFKELLLGFFD